MDGAQRSETAGIFAAALGIADFLVPLISAPQIDAEMAGAAGLNVAKRLRELKQRLEQVPSFVDVPPDVLAALKAVARIVRYAHTDCPAFGDMALHLGRSDLRVAAVNGWQALQRSDPENDAVLSWADEKPGEAAGVEQDDLITTSEGQQLTLLDRFPDTAAGNIQFLEWVYLEVREQAEALRQNKYPHDSIQRQLTGGGVKWAEARTRVARLPVLPGGVIERVAKVLRRDLNIGTVEQVGDLLGPALRDLRDAWENSKASDDDGPTDNRPHASLVDLINRVIRRLEAKPDLLRGYDWDHPETLNASEINAAAKALGLGPVFAIDEAPDWAQAPNLPPDHPVNQHKVECLTIYHPNGSAFQIRRAGRQLDDNTSLPVAETLVRLEAWSNTASQKPHLTASVENAESAGDRDAVQPKRRGRKKADYETIQREASLAADWKRARDAGVFKCDFARERGLTVAKLDALLDRVAKRNRRPE